ncbi:DNA translocase FtsK [Palleronia sp. KMU-117]|uniref:DNA translocase FtsK n=1 Tax=Palleronia sp. KMU-117 TaxID=3434108 RepID=UPI003D715AC8
MAYQARQRDPLFDRDTQAVLERRATELLGLALLCLGIATAMVVASYSPTDPSWLSATDEPARNLLGRFGASIASPLFVIVGYASWTIAAIFTLWGARLLAHVGEDRLLSRIIFAPIAVALASVYASTHVPGADWGHSFGLGGLFGDTVLGAILGVVPVQATLGLKVLSFFMFFGAMAMLLFVLGATMAEMRGFGLFLLRGTVMLYDRLVALVVWAIRAGMTSAGNARARRAERAARAEEQAFEAAPFAAPKGLRLRREPPVAGTAETAPAKPGLLARMSPLIARKAEAAAAPVGAGEDAAGEDDRIKARIADIIRNRSREPVATVGRAEPPVTAARHPRGPKPMILDTARTLATPPFAADDEALFADVELPEPELVEPEPIRPGAMPMFETGRLIPTEGSVVQHAARKPLQPSRQARAEAQPALRFDDKAPAYETPPLSLLASPDRIERHQLSDEALEENARMLENVLDDYGVKGEIVSVRPGPVVTMYELEPAPGLKASRVIGLADDIARSMSALSARVSTVPGRSVIGIELPNEKREKVVLREILSARDYGDANHRLPLALGKDISGDPVVANLAKMPHLLIAGTTGSGKSVAINTMILSLLYKLTPEECRLIMIDPKMLELSVYDGIPHLLSPVVTDPKKAVVALKWVVGEMEDRYRKMSKMGVRNIEGYNGRVREALEKGELFKRTVQTGFDDETGEPVFETEEFAPELLPYIVVIVDEMADLMMVAGKEIEACIQRLAQMARASGIHLIMATQRPSVDVITGTIKANFPTRISFQVTSKIDSRTILGEQGAEQLLGMGDMLFMAGGSRITRVHGPFVSDEEVEEIVNHLKSYGAPEYVTSVLEGPDDDRESDIDLVLGLGGASDGDDALYDQAVAIVIKDRKCSTSYIQRKLAIGYNKAARLVEQMEEEGVVSRANHVGKREILVPEQG